MKHRKMLEDRLHAVEQKFNVFSLNQKFNKSSVIYFSVISIESKRHQRLNKQLDFRFRVNFSSQFLFFNRRILVRKKGLNNSELNVQTRIVKSAFKTFNNFTLCSSFFPITVKTGNVSRGDLWKKHDTALHDRSIECVKFRNLVRRVVLCTSDIGPESEVSKREVSSLEKIPGKFDRTPRKHLFCNVEIVWRKHRRFKTHSKVYKKVSCPNFLFYR